MVLYQLDSDCQPLHCSLRSHLKVVFVRYGPSPLRLCFLIFQWDLVIWLTYGG